jgi:hypothetical protein
MMRAYFPVEKDDAGVILWHITALLLPNSGVSFGIVTATMQVSVGAEHRGYRIATRVDQ